MIQNILYGKKLILPSTQANVTQSLQMAAAFSATGIPTTFWPGLNARRLNENTRALNLKDALNAQLAEAGITPAPATWKALHGGHKGLYGLNFRLHLVAALRSKPEALIYARDVAEASFIAAARRRFFFRKNNGKFLFEMHEILFRQHRDFERRTDWQKTKLREQAILAETDGLVVVNEELAELAVKEFDYAGDVIVASNGINEKSFRPLELFTEHAPWPGPDDAVNLIYIGSARQGKGLMELLRAMPMLSERFRLKIIGAGNEEVRHELDRLANEAPDWRERVVLTGHLPQGRIHAACRGAHISMVPQQEYGGYFSPLKLNESLALGLPVICTPLKVFAHQKELVFQSGDCTPEGLAAAIAELAASPEKARKLNERGLRYVKEQTWLTRAERILKFADGL